jgi:hypothetical protein
VSTLQAVYFRAADGSEPVREFIAELEAKPRAALKRQIDRLNDLSDAIARELRFASRMGLRNDTWLL